MPNATLCGKAVVEMVLAHLSDKAGKAGAAGEVSAAVKEVQTKLVTDGNLPKAYLITKERIERCKHIPSVLEQDEKGIVGLRGEPDELVQGGRNGV